MAPSEADLREKYDLTTLRVRSSTHISGRTAAVLAKLSSSEAATPPLVALTADAKATSKLISIVEIAKRELVSKNVKVYQYNGLASKLIQIDREPKNKGHKSGHASDTDDDPDDAFETTGVTTEISATKTRLVPIMTIYLAISPVRELKVAFG